MPDCVPVFIHQTQWPASLAGRLRRCLQSRRIDPRFLYETPRQVRHWLKVHEAHSPARREAEFRGCYEAAFSSAVPRLGAGPVHLIGLGCGGGRKEAALLARLNGAGRRVTYTAVDGSSGMVLTALQAAWEHLEPAACSGLVCDLAEAADHAALLERFVPGDSARVFTFFGVIPNLDAVRAQSLLRGLVRSGDVLLCSANLAPGADYRAGVEQVLPQYDNPLTRDWLGLLLADLGVADGDGAIRFGIQEVPGPIPLLRIRAWFEFRRSATVRLEEESFEFPAGSSLELLFSDRHTISTVGQLLRAASLERVGSWVSPSGEEGVFLAVGSAGSGGP